MTALAKGILAGIVVFVMLISTLYVGAILGYKRAMADVVILQEQMKREKVLKEKEIELEKREQQK